MFVALGHGAAGQGHVDGLGGHAGLELGGGEGGLAGLECGLKTVAHLVGELAHLGALLGAQFAHGLEDGRELALLAGDGNADLIEGLEVARSLDRGQGALGNALQIVENRHADPFVSGQKRKIRPWRRVRSRTDWTAVPP